MNNEQLDINLVIEQLMSQISALNLENAILKARIKSSEKDDGISVRIPANSAE